MGKAAVLRQRDRDAIFREAAAFQISPDPHNKHTWLAHDNGKQIGRLAVEPDPEGSWIADMEVHPDYRRQGVGRAMWEAAGRPAHTPDKWSREGEAFARGVGGDFVFDDGLRGKFKQADMAAVIGGTAEELPDHNWLQHGLGDDEDWGITTARLAILSVPQPISMAQGDLTYSKPAPGSSHGAEIHNGSDGTQWLVKKAPPHAPSMVDMDVAANRIASHSGLEAPPAFKMTTPEGGVASAQLMYPHAKDAFPTQMDPEALHDDDLLTIQKHHALDWLLSNHDDHKQNFIRTQDGKLVGIDKGQAMKFFNNDRLHWNFFPNEHEPVHNTLYRNMAQGGRKLFDPREGELGQYIQGLQDIPDQDYQDMLRPYAEAAAKEGILAKDFKAAGYHAHHGGEWYPADARIPSNDPEAFLKAATERKNNLMQDFGDLYDRAHTHALTGSGVA